MPREHFCQGNYFLDKNDLNKAVQAYQVAIELNPDFYLAYYNLGEALEKIGRLREAVEAYKHAVRLQPQDVWSRLSLGRLLMQLGRVEEAIALKGQLVENHPKFKQSASAIDDYHQWLVESQPKIQSFKNRHQGERCVIIGNGPSLNKMDLSFLKHEICFGTNKVFLGFEAWGFCPNYYVAVNHLVLQQNYLEIMGIPCPKFLSNRGLAYFNQSSDIIFLRTYPSPKEQFSLQLDHGLTEGSTVTYAALQLAYYMGFKEVILIGVDHHFITEGQAHQECVSNGEDLNHFHVEYFGKNTKWNLPDLKTSESYYKLAKEVFEADNRRIIDATLDGHCPVFEKQDYRHVFNNYFLPITDLQSLSTIKMLSMNSSQDAFVTPNQDFISLYYKATKLMAQEDYRSAISDYQQAIQLNSDYFWSHYYLGQAYLKVEQYQEALGALETAVQLDPTHPEAQGYLTTAQSLVAKKVSPASSPASSLAPFPAPSLAPSPASIKSIAEDNLEILSHEQSKLEKLEQDLIKEHPIPNKISLPTQKIPLRDRVSGLQRVLKIYNKTYEAVYKEKLLELREKFKHHDRAFIIGNGPSLNETDLELLNNEVTFGVNGIFLKSQDTGWKPTFYVVEDHLVAEDRQDSINKYKGPIKLFPINLAYCLNEDSDTIFFDHRPRVSYPDGYDFSTDASVCTYTGCTVTYTCMQLAYFLGFKDIYLIGVDASYSIPEDVKVDQEYKTDTLDMESDDVNHFHPDYFGKGYRWHDPQVNKMKEAYREARRVCNETDVNMINATLGGQLEVFPRVNYYSLFHHNRISPRLLIIDMTKVGSISATGQVKKNLLEGWSPGNWLQLYAQGNDLRLFSEADLIPGGDRVVSEAEVLTECTRFNPKVIYYRPVADKPFLHTIACKLIEKIGCPVVTHVMDDWLDRLYHQNSSLFSKFDTTTRLLLEQSAARLSICDQMSVAFEERYGVDFVAIANCVDANDWTDLPQSQVPSPSDTETSPFTIRYIGGLADDMNFQSLVDIANSVSQLSQQLPIQLEIYTARFWQDKAVKTFSSLDNVHIHESKLSQQEYRQLLATADALIIAYNFDAESIRYVKYSMANKLPECLASGTPVLAYGPLEVATINYAAETEVVNVVSERNLEQLKQTLQDFFLNPEPFQKLAKKAQKLVFERHSNRQICHKFQTILRKASTSGKPVQNLMSSLLTFELESGFSQTDHASLNATDLVFEISQTLAGDDPVMLNVGEQQQSNLEKFADQGWKTLNYTRASLNDFSISQLQTKIKEDNLTTIDFLRLETAGQDLTLLKALPWSSIQVNVVECQFNPDKINSQGHELDAISQYLMEKGYQVVVSEWYPQRQYRFQSDWYRLWIYPGSPSDPNAWGQLLAFKEPPTWQHVLESAKRILMFHEPEVRTAKYHIHKADELDKNGQLESAVQELMIAIEIEPKKMEAYYRLGEVLLRLNRFEESIHYYQQTIELKPDYFWAFRGLGDAYRELGELERALHFYTKVVKINPDYFYGHEKRGRVLQALGEFDAAISCYQKALGIKPNSPITEKALKKCLEKKQSA